MSCISCSVNNVNNISSESKLNAKVALNYGLINRLSTNVEVKPTNTYSSPLKSVRLSSEVNVSSSPNLNFGLTRRFANYADSDLKSIINLNAVIRSNVVGVGNIPLLKTDKFSGNKLDFAPYEKLYPSGDVYFISKINNDPIFDNETIYSLVDEGVFTQDYTNNNSIGTLISDDSISQVVPLGVFNEGDLEYKFIVNKPLSVAKKSYFAIRASAPFDSYKNRRPQQYKIYDIKLEDPNGNLIIQYEDITVKGDTYFTTYISQPKINNLLLGTWEDDYPLMDEAGDYTLKFSLTFDCTKYPFNEKFDSGFEESCIIESGYYNNIISPIILPFFDNDTPLRNLSISSIEIGNSGGIGILRDNYINIFNYAQQKSQRVTKTFIPTQLFTTDFDNGIYPQASSTWVAYPQEINNTTENGANALLNNLNSASRFDYILLSGSLPHQDSGRLILKFDTTLQKPEYERKIDGSFSFGIQNFEIAKDINYVDPDVFFEADSLRLKIVAKKSENTPDFSIDVVGYSNDRILNVTPAIGGFLQNDPSVSYIANELPDTSGIYNTSLTISENPFSDDADYVQKDISPFGDHYHVTTTPVINTTEFAEYIIPLQIMHDPYKVGPQTKYGLTSFLENLYLDISPLPSGAIISNIVLLVDYIPSDALMLHTMGCPSERYMKLKSLNLIPTYKDEDYITNTSGALTNIPHGLSNPPSLKTNYARRWRGVDNNVGSGAFDIIEFNNYEFAFTYPTNPFLYGYTDFRDVDGYDVYDNDGRRLLAEFAGNAGDSISDHLYQNIGWRLSSDQLFDNNPTTPYKSISWNSNIYDAFDRAVRVSGVDYYLSLGNVQLSSNGWAIFLRFTPDNTIPDNQCILSRINGSDVKIKLKYNGGNLFAEADNGNIFVETGLYWDECQYPLSVLLTYNDDGENRLKIYADNELDDNFTYLLGQSEIFDYYDSSNNLNIGHCELSGDEDLPMFIHEFGISNLNCNIVPDNLDRTNQQTTVDSLFKSHRMHFWKTGDTSYRSDQHTYIDDDVSKWHLGAFKICSFSPDFDFFTERDGNDYLMHTLVHDGRAYSEIINQNVPSSLLLSGVAYHTQVENDFLRFNLSDIPDYYGDTFYGIAPRISKNLPRGYKFNEDGICVDTIIEHDCNNQITWSNGNIGPKLIVSLYTPLLNYDTLPSKDFGLINRSIHYLEPSGCYQKITSKFTFDNLTNESEPWALFDPEIYQKEFKERYFDREINDMYLQYDIVYPSGSSFNSTIKIHTSNVRLDSSLVLSSGVDSNFTLYASGDAYQDGYLDLIGNYGCLDISESGLQLVTSGAIFRSTRNLKLFVSSSGIFSESPYINLHTLAKSSIVFQENSFGDNLFGASQYVNPVINFYVSGQYMREESVPLHTYGQGLLSDNNVSFVTFGKDDFLLDSEYGDRLSLYILSNQPINVFPSSSMPLFTSTVPYYTFVSSQSDLFIEAYDPNQFVLSESLVLHTLNYPISESLAANSAAINWDSTNPGSNITSSDDIYAYVDSDDNIRGVDIICYGNCVSSIPCSETPVTIHGTTYYEDNCVDGGIFRAKTTYTNLTFESGIFKHDDVYTSGSYSGHFYGIRKYEGLAPSLPYTISIEGRTGSNIPIDIPTEFVEVEYNQNETDEVDNGQTLMNYNGFRLIANSEYRNTGNKFGKSVASKEDLLAIGAPGQTVDYSEGLLASGGTVFLYRRQARPEGYDWPQENYKSPWILDDIISLPSGLRKDYSLRFPEDKIEFAEYNLSIQKTRWYTGQEGREFGHSLDLAINKDMNSIGEDSRQILVVGGPNAKWSRSFPELETDTINIGIMAFIDEFKQTIPTELYPRRPLVELDYTYILQAIENKDFLYRYFAEPSVRFNINLIIYVTNADDPTAQTIIWNDAPKNYPLNITVKQISRNQVEADPELQTQKIINGMKAGFFESFPSSGDIPPIVGFYIDNSFSLGKDSLQPALSGFMDFYRDYSYASGLYTNRVKDSGQVVELIPSNSFDPKNWIYYSHQLINDVLDSGNIIERNHLRFITDAIGEFYGSQEEFNIPPESGGKVYIFEKESGYWNLIQEIKSPNVTYGYPDRFGHAVSISDNSEVIAVGSPYISQAVMAYEYKPEQKDIYYNNLYSWIISKGKESIYSDAIDTYLETNDIHGLYLSLSSEDKFLSRRDLGIEEYQTILSFGYGDIQPIGSWSFIPNAVAPTARLGYSIDVSEDGNKIVVGSPTDSFNQFNDADIYYAYNGSFRGNSYYTSYSDEFGLGIPNSIKSSWASTVNAGAIHVFESRNYYPHNAVVEYGRFGNLHRSINDIEGSPDFGHFEYISGVFSDKPFIRTEFTQNSIPQEAGLLFIITPEVDALSDEVADNLINWLALGDRNLVLVGNDPTWESNGAYKNSNEIINKILQRLNSRMKIVPARNRYESLPNGYSDFDNILSSFVPYGITSTFTRRLPLRGSGVADIRITNTFSGTVQNCVKQVPCGSEPPAIQIQSRCEMPLVDGGDLRAQSVAICCADNGKPLTYYVNWPYEYKTYIPSCADIDFNEDRRPLANREPIPLLTAAEKINVEIDVPEIPAKYVNQPRYKEVPSETRISYVFGTQEESKERDFVWLSNVNNYTLLDQNYTTKITQGLFINPPGSGLLQATGKLRIADIEYEIDKVLDEKARYCVSEKYSNTDSEVVLIANTKGEIAEALTTSTGNNNDRNRGFYLYLFEKNSSLAQLALWEENGILSPQSFADAVDNSILNTVLSSTRVKLRQNISIDTLLSPADFEFDNAWISNVGKYSELSSETIDKLKTWLSRGKKKLFITYDNYQSDEDKKASLDKVTYLCNMLGIKIKPLKFDSYKDNLGGTSIDVSRMQIPDLEYINSIYFGSYNPISIEDADSNKVTTLAYQDTPIIQKVTQLRPGNYWYMEAGVTKVSFPVDANSGYKIFIVTDSHTDTATVPITVQIGNAISQPELPSPTLYSTPLIDLVDYKEEQVDSITGDFLTYEISKVGTTEISVQTGNNQSSLDLYISSNKARLSNDDLGDAPQTIKLMAISGVGIPVLEQYEQFSTLEFDGYDIIKISDPVPGYKDTIQVIRTIQTDNTKYCTDKCLYEGLGGQLIEDGPIVAAQELEFITSFDAGYNRSRITLLSDASMIQGRYLSDNNMIPLNTYEFIRSLYPETNFEFANYGRQFVSHTKIVSPERGSPLKYLKYSDGSLPGLNDSFGGFIYDSIDQDKINKYESQYDPILVNRPEVPWKDEIDGDKIEEIKNELISGFLNTQSAFGITCKFSGVFEGSTYIDTNVAGGIPDLFKENGYDYLDFDYISSGYPGDLFGYSVGIRKNTIIVGSPFSAFGNNIITPYDENSSFYLGYDGGAGSVYMFQKTGNGSGISKNSTPWECTRKFRPDTLMGQLSGINVKSDQFGHAVSINEDMFAVGAPNHDYSNQYDITGTSGSFVRKSFDEAFYITKRRVIDLGNSGIRDSLSINDSYGDNTGAIYVYDNKIVDWENKIQDWTLTEKVVATTYDSGNNYERFGKNVYLSTPYRTDSDYLLAVGCDTASGDNLLNIGAAYTKDIMLRKQPPSLLNSGSWISAKVFGYRDEENEPTISLAFENSNGDFTRYFASGEVISDENGQIFLEVSGQDPSTKGFIIHRPYIKSVIGKYNYGLLQEGGMVLYTDGKNAPEARNINLFIDVENNAYVYNTLGLYSKTIIDSGSSPILNMFIESPSGDVFDSMNLYCHSGVAQPNNSLNLRIRGK